MKYLKYRNKYILQNIKIEDILSQNVKKQFCLVTSLSFLFSSLKAFRDKPVFIAFHAARRNWIYFAAFLIEKDQKCVEDLKYMKHKAIRQG
jgi:hypothetical protein